MANVTGHSMVCSSGWHNQTPRCHGPAAFAHHEDLPVVQTRSGTATVFLGEFAGALSPAAVDWPLVGVEISTTGSSEFELERDFEHGVAVLTGGVTIGGTTVTTNQFVYLGSGRHELRFDAEPGTRLLLLGGEPFGLEVLMWWNFVARGRGMSSNAPTPTGHRTLSGSARWPRRWSRLTHRIPIGCADGVIRR